MNKFLLARIMGNTRVAVLFFILLFCCTPEIEDQLPVSDYSLNAPQDGVRPMQIVSIDVSGLTNLEDQYKGTFGGTEVDLFREGDSQLFFVVPASATEGSQTLNVALNSREKSVEFTVLKKVELPDGNAYLNGLLQDAKAELGTESGDARVQEFAEALAGWVSAYESALASLSEEEKGQLALLLKTNLAVEEGNASMRLLEYDCFDKYAPIYLKNFALMFAGGQLVYSSQVLNVALPGLGFAVGVAGGVAFLQGAKRVLETARDIHDCPIFRYLESYNFNSRVLQEERMEFQSSQTHELVLHAHYRSLDRDDTNHSVPLIRQIAESILEFEGLLKTFTQRLNVAKGMLGLQAKTLQVDDTHVLQATGKTQTGALLSGLVTVENITNEKVKLGETGLMEGKLSLNFKSESLSPQEFDFDLVIKDGPIEHREKIGAKVMPEEVVIEAIGLEELNAEPGSDLTIQIRVLTKSGLAVKNADVVFSIISGDGTFQQLKVNTDAEGLAVTELKVSQENSGDIEFMAKLLDESGEQNLSNQYIIKAKGDLFLGKWYLISISTNDRSSIHNHQNEEKFVNSHMTFFPDNLFEFDITGFHEEGTWNDKGMGHYIKMTDEIYIKIISGENLGDENTLKITKLTEHEMIWYYKVTGTFDHDGRQVSFVREDEWYFKRTP